MKAIRPLAPGGADVLLLEDFPTPAPARGQLLVRVEAAGVNFIDVYQRTGLYPVAPPMPLGLEGAGIVEAIGDGVAGIALGDRVAWARAPGSYATHVLVDASVAVPVPSGIDAPTAAAAMLQGMTAHYLVKSTYRLSGSDTCVVYAAAGGVGLLLCQMAKRIGARVIGVVSTDEKAARARAAGADEIVMSSADVASEVKRLTAGVGANVVYDSVGKDTFEASLASLALRGMLVMFGQSSGLVPPFDLRALNTHGSLFVTRPSLHHYVHTREELLERASDVLGAIARGELHITIDSTFALADARSAHEKLTSRKTIGKVLLAP
jgi:NADPH2:quinone reductase